MKLINKYQKMPVQLKASFWFLICAFLQKSISAITTPIFTRLMSTSEYGQYNVFNSWMSIITCFTTLNIYGGVYTQGLVKFESDRNRYASAFQGLLFTLSALWVIVYSIIHVWVNPSLDLTTTQGYLMLLIIWLSGVFQLWAQEQRVQFKYRVLVLVTLIYSLLTPIIGIALIRISNDKVTARILGVAIASVIAYTWQFFYQLIRGKTFFSGRIWKYAFSLSLPLIPHYLSQMILNSSDRIMIKSMVGASEAGIYSLAYSVSLIMVMFNTSLLSTIEPWIYQKIKEKQIDHLPKVAYPAFLGIAGVNLLLIMFAPEVIKIFAPVQYYEAIYVIPPVTMSVYFQFMYSFFALFEFYYEKTQYITIATLTGAVINIVTNYIFIRLFGYIAAGYTTLFCYIIYAFMHYIFMRKICHKYLNDMKPYNIKIILVISAGFMIAGFIMLFTYSYPFVRYSIIAVTIIVLILKRCTIKSQLKQLLSMRKV